MPGFGTRLRPTPAPAARPTVLRCSPRASATSSGYAPCCTWSKARSRARRRHLPLIL